MPLLPSEYAWGHEAHHLGRSQPSQSPAAENKQQSITICLQHFNSSSFFLHGTAHDVFQLRSRSASERSRLTLHSAFRKNPNHCTIAGHPLKKEGEGYARMTKDRESHTQAWHREGEGAIASICFRKMTCPCFRAHSCSQSNVTVL